MSNSAFAFEKALKNRTKKEIEITDFSLSIFLKNPFYTSTTAMIYGTPQFGA